MHDWNRLMAGVVARFVMDPVPVRVEHLISGRWGENGEGSHQERAAAISRSSGSLYDSMAKNGQSVPIVARYQVGIDIPEAQLWPSLRIHPPVLNTLAKRLLVYEGNHRLAVARMLRWSYVLVEPRLWVWRGVDPVVAKLEARDILDGKVIAGLGNGYQWRTEVPIRDDGRPMDPEKVIGIEPFFGNPDLRVAAWMINKYAQDKARQPVAS